MRKWDGEVGTDGCDYTKERVKVVWWPARGDEVGVGGRVVASPCMADEASTLHPPCERSDVDGERGSNLKRFAFDGLSAA